MRLDRREKLRRLAEHPTTPLYEAAAARARLAETGPLNLGAALDNAATAILNRWRRERYPDLDWDGIEAAQRARSERVRTKRWSPDDAEYAPWARSLAVGANVRVRCDPGISEGLERGIRDADAPHAMIARVTATRYVMADGRRFRRAGQFPGYMVGEDGRNGRHWIEP